jgi:aarF domain-containing kinase
MCQGSRFVRIYSSAALAILVYVGVQSIVKLLGLSEDSSLQAKLYSTADHVVAPFMCEQFVELKSVFVKFGQYLGARADIVPEHWAHTLKKLQDDLPSDSRSYVEKTVTENFGRSMGELFESFDYEPLASASIAQVHKAVLKDKRQVVVKVQHANINEIIKDDLRQTIRISKFMAYLNPKYDTLVTVFTSWSSEMLKELDFEVEAFNLRLVHTNLRQAGLVLDEPNPENRRHAGNCVVPLPSAPLLVPVDSVLNSDSENDTAAVPLVYKKVFCMDFIDGYKVSDNAWLDHYAVDRAHLAHRLVQAFSQQLFIDGVFNADPHPGNIMVTFPFEQRPKNSGDSWQPQPVLLDFGMTITLSKQHRLGYARLIYSVSKFDMSGLKQAFDLIGYANSQSDKSPDRDMEFFSHILRNTGSRKNQKAASAEFTKTRREQKQQDLSKGDNGGRYLSQIPDSLYFIFRVIGLIRGLCTTLEVSLPYLDIMAEFAMKALILETPNPMHYRLQEPTPLIAGANLQAKISSLLKLLAGEASQNRPNASLTGIQVVVYVNEQKVVDCAEGVLGEVNPKSVAGTTLFPLADMSLLILSILVNQIFIHVKKGSTKIDRNTKVHQTWPTFVPSEEEGGFSEKMPPSERNLNRKKKSITLRDVLTHRHGLESIFHYMQV